MEAYVIYKYDDAQRKRIWDNPRADFLDAWLSGLLNDIIVDGVHLVKTATLTDAGKDFIGHWWIMCPADAYSKPHKYHAYGPFQTEEAAQVYKDNHTQWHPKTTIVKDPSDSPRQVTRIYFRHI